MILLIITYYVIRHRDPDYGLFILLAAFIAGCTGWGLHFLGVPFWPAIFVGLCAQVAALGWACNARTLRDNNDNNEDNEKQ